MTQQEYRAAGERYQQRLRDEPHIVAAEYDVVNDRVVVSLSSGVPFKFRPDDAQGLQGATIEQLRTIEISPMKFGLHFPLLDAHFDITAMMKGHLGTQRWMAARAIERAEANMVRSPSVRTD